MHNETTPPRMRWLLLLHQLPARAAKGRVRVWRRLQQIGAVALRGSAYVLPHTPQAVEDFEWLRVEIIGLGGTAGVFEGRPVDPGAEAEMVKQFRDHRSADYEQLRTDIRVLMRRVTPRGRRGSVDRSVAPEVQALRKRFQRVAKGDPIGGPLRDEVARELIALEQQLIGRPTVAATAPAMSTAQLFEARTWVTRPRPGVDRMASAWLIRTFIDPNARFVFADQPAPDQVAFDMYEGDFTHQGDACTCEVLVRRFRIDDKAVRRVAEVVHDLDLKDDKYRHAEGGTVGVLVDGVCNAEPDDARALEAGITLFAALHRGLQMGGGAETAPARSAPARRAGARTKRVAR
jgi:hypothetical protein